MAKATVSDSRVKSNFDLFRKIIEALQEPYADQLNKNDALLGQLGAQLAMMSCSGGNVFDESMSEQDRSWYVHTMENHVFELKEIAKELWGVNSALRDAIEAARPVL